MGAMDEASLAAAVEFMRNYDDGLSSVRYPRDNVSLKFAEQACPPFELGKARCLTPQFGIGAPGNNGVGVPDVAVLAFGTSAIDAIAAGEMVAAEDSDLRVAVYDARFAKPVDSTLIRDLLSRNVPIVTVEDHSVIGGFGTAVLEAAASMGLDASNVHIIGLPDSWIYQDSRGKQLAQAGIDPTGIARTIRKVVQSAGRAEQRTGKAEVQIKTATPARSR
jgi:1-deoxy-D-xylulose-5-phosphate synthase